MIKEREVLLKINKLSLKYFQNNVQTQILDNISIDLHNKEILSILGESGSGKTSMAKSILNLHREKTALISGEIIYKKL